MTEIFSYYYGMHIQIACQILFMAFFSFFKPEKTAAHATIARHHKTTKISHIHSLKRVRARHTYYSATLIDTTVATGETTPDELVAFAKTLKGIRYRFGSSDPDKGFDCSGFVNYVFRHFNISIPRSSADFEDSYGHVDLKDAHYGDLILFTGTKRSSKHAGHIGIVVSAPGEPLTFIHSTSGNAHGVTETVMDDYYMGRFMKTIRLFPDNEMKVPADSTALAATPR